MRLGLCAAAATLGMASAVLGQDIVDDAGTARGGKVGSWCSMASDGGGLAISYYCERDGADQYALRFAWKDAGIWKRTTISSNAGGAWGQMVRGSDGKYHVFWQSWAGIKWASGSASQWTISPFRVDNGLVQPVSIAVVLDSANRPHVTYVEADPDGDGALHYTRWNGSAWVHDSGDVVALGAYSTSQLGGDYLDLESTGVPVVAYIIPGADGSGPIHVARLVGGAWQDELIGADGYQVKMVLGADDAPRVVYSTESGLEYATRMAGVWKFESIAPGVSASSISLTLDADGSPVVGFRREDSVDCATRSGGVWTLAPVDEAGPSEIRGATGTSVRVDSDGVVRLAYGALTYDGTGWFIEDLRCGVPVGSCVSIDAQPRDAVSCPSGPVSFSIAASGGGSMTYAWQASLDGTSWTTLVEGLNSLGGGQIVANGVATATVTLSGSAVGDDAPSPLVPLQIRAKVGSDCGGMISGVADLAVCEADFNCDGLSNTLDVLAFLNAWSARKGSADYNGDGSVNTLDVLGFLNAWSSGC
ncbi:MAG: hypothetical protein IPJ41_18055 [Phycisphaerales bacterium]|nr:hypothetical protein [Phycisphaerales bacterium]